jgi:hypothetical protein
MDYRCVEIIYVPKDGTIKDATHVLKHPHSSVVRLMTERTEAAFSEELAPFEPPTQKLVRVGEDFKLKQVPHWSSRYCPFGAACGCDQQKEVILGTFHASVTNGFEYVPRKMYRDIVPEVQP